MINLTNSDASRAFYFFERICSIPHGSGDMNRIADFCERFAIEHGLKYVRDEADNIVIYKPASSGYESAEPIVLQGHMDMVCQKADGVEKDFANEGIEPFVDGDFIKAKGTTLGADNGIAIAIILAILESKEYKHPPIEAIFTVDEEIGLLGAGKLNCSCLNGKKMINIDSEEDDTVTVSCAGGRNFIVDVPLTREAKAGSRVSITLRDLQGGHSGIEIHKGRVNANILMARVLNHFRRADSVNLISINGGDKSNAITNLCTAELLVDNAGDFVKQANEYLNDIKCEISARESDFEYIISSSEGEGAEVITNELKNQLVCALVASPQGVIDMSADIEGLVETSMNLGILKTSAENMRINYSFRSNKRTAMDYLEEKMYALYSTIPCEIKISGGYPSWEYKADSPLRELYCSCYAEHYGKSPKIEAIHAGLECGVFDSKIANLDCISVGPNMFDVHTFNERLSISSTENVFRVILKVLEKSM